MVVIKTRRPSNVRSATHMRIGGTSKSVAITAKRFTRTTIFWVSSQPSHIHITRPDSARSC